MVNVKELRGRIKSVKNIAQITKAMEMVASMKLRRVQARALSIRPYMEELAFMGRRLSKALGGDADMPLFRRQVVKAHGMFVVTSDRGLCGAYNANVLARLHRKLDECRASNLPVRLYVYGRKGYSYLTRRRFKVEKYFVDPPLDKMDFDAARLVVAKLVEDFRAHVVDDVHVFYTQFLTPSKFEPTEVPLLAVPRHELVEETASGFERDYLIEPDPQTLLDLLVPKFLETVVYTAMLQSLAAEHASRRMAMKGATDAAKRMTSDLRRVYNRKRQEGITKELLDIVGGTAAVTGS